MFQRLSRHLKSLQTDNACRDNKSATADLATAGYLVALVLLFCLEMLSGCAATQPAMSEKTGTPDIDIRTEYQQALQHMQAEEWQAAREILTRITKQALSLIHISEPTRLVHSSRMPSSA